LHRLGEEVLAFYEWTKPTESERRLRAQVFACFEKVVAEIWPNAKCELFGSMQTDIYLPDGCVHALRAGCRNSQLTWWGGRHSDFDVVVQDDSLRHHSTYSVLSTLKTAVVKCRFAQHHEVRLVTGAKVPIVKLKTTDKFGRFDMDVSFNSDKGPEGARESLRLLKEVEMRRPGNAERVKRLALLLKTLLVTYDLNEVRDGGIGGLTVFCMALSHVQVRVKTSSTLAPSETSLTCPS
jgi:non-canonical poly(A) RNA polymerase PAPD5/7